MNRAAKTASVVMLLLIATLSYGWVSNGDTWPTPTAPFRVNPNFPVATVGSVEQQTEAIRCAAATWSQQTGSSFEFSFLGPTTATSTDPFDGVNSAHYTPANGGGGLLAVAIRGMSGSTVEGFDLVFFGENDLGPITWNASGDPSVGEEDIAAVATHEFGHVLGLDHSSVDGSTMLATSIGVMGRTLHADDIAGVQALYGMGGAVDGTPAINDVVPATGPTGGGYPVEIIGENFTWGADTELRIDGVVVDPALYEVESSCRIQLHAMPSHLPGPVSIRVTNELGDRILDDAFEYLGTAPGSSPVLRVGTTIASPGSTDVAVEIEADTDFQLGGFSWAIAFDPSQANVQYVSLIGTDAEGADFVAPTYDNVAGWWTLTVALDILPPVDRSIPAGSDRRLARAFYEMNPAANDGFTAIGLVSGLGAPPSDIVLSEFSTGSSFTPTTLDGGIFVTAGPTFTRGDANRDGIVDLSDAVFHLEWLFLNGPALCLDAHDLNDDGSPNIADAVYGLNFLFTLGPSPLAPYPGVGVDGTPDGLGCQ